MMSHAIRFCSEQELDTLLQFIDIHWKKDHIFVKRPDLLKWQHYDSTQNIFNFVVAENKLDGEFDGILGFIPVAHFDPSSKSKDIWLAIWKINEEKAKGLLSGLDMLSFLKKEYKPKTIASIGISETAKKIYKVMGYNVGVLNHYFIPNEEIKEFGIIQMNPDEVSSIKYDDRISKISKVVQIKDMNELEGFTSSYCPNKSVEYIINRYVNHPMYRYKLMGIYSEGALISVLVTRIVGVDNCCCIRIVDIIGNLGEAGNIYKEVQLLLSEEGAEYIDLMCHGIESDILSRIGFIRRNDSHVIPNYFEPFVKANTDIEYAYKSQYDRFLIFKGDSDQDRPNLE